MATEGILLESGTNEVEILEFMIAGQHFGVNVLKIQAIEQHHPERVTAMPMAHRSVAGSLLFRGRTIPMIDLGAELNIDRPAKGEDAVEEEKRIVLVTEFNNTVNSFLVDGVNRIHRISWNKFVPLSTVFASYTSEFTGSVNIEGREILILDLEKIVADVLPDQAQRYAEADEDVTDHPRKLDRPSVKVFLAEDSDAIRAMIVKQLGLGGYTSIRQFPNGQACHEALLEIKAKIDRGEVRLADEISVLVTDIEMPQMDGLTLCRNVKENLGMGHLPVVLFSSLVSEQLKGKCQAVGADRYIAKPQCGKVVELLDELCLQEQATA